MSVAQCSIPTCTGKLYGHGYCVMHYGRWKRHGNPLTTLLPRHKLDTKTPEYAAWTEMRRRCRDRSRPGWAGYGGRGITVCDRWQSYPNFLADMGERPSSNYSLERKDNDKGYGPDNCRWANKKAQANNRRNSHLIEIGGVTQTLQQWCDEFDIADTTVHSRLKRGWTPYAAIMTPPKKS